MDINELPDKCPRCGHTIFKQKIPIHGYANKMYMMNRFTADIDHPVMVVETNQENSDYNNDIVCNACGAIIVEADINRSK